MKLVYGPFRVFLVILGMLSLGVGIIGAFVPVLPTTPFVLLSAWCFSKSSEKLHSWLLRQKKIGPMIQDWDEHGVIRPRVKWISQIMLYGMLSYPLLFKDLEIEIKGAIILIAFGVSAFILTRPSSPKKN